MLTSTTLRLRLTKAMSTDRTRRPIGIIQKPRTGRKPNKPKSVMKEPSAIRNSGLFGRFTVQPASLIALELFDISSRSASRRTSGVRSTAMHDVHPMSSLATLNKVSQRREY